MNQKVTKIVFSGGPGVGKTTILNELKNLGYEVRSEVFTEIFSQANKENVFEILFQNKKKLIFDLIEFQNKNEEIDFIPKENLLFLDRGMHDIFGFSQQLEYRLDAEELFQIQNQNYDLCIIPDPLEGKFYDQNLAKLNGAIIGCVKIKLIDKKTLMFGMLVAHPEHRSQGIGKKLILFVENFAQSQGYRKVCLELLTPKNWIHSQKEFLKSWYMRLGYIKQNAVAFDKEEHLITPCELTLYSKDLK